MAKAKAVWAIDLGQSALKALQVGLLGDKLQVEAFEVIPHDQILSGPDVDRPALIRKALGTLVSRHQFAGEPVAISVPGQLSFARFTKLPPVEPKKIPDIVKFEAGQQIPFGIDEVIWDYQIFRKPESPEVEVGIFAMKKQLIYEFISYFREVHIEPQLVQMAPLALYNYMMHEQLLDKQASILIDVGAENTDLIIAEDHRLWQRNIPLGGNNFTQALVQAFKLNFSKAEKLKCTAATSKYARQVFQTMRPVFADLSAEVQRSIGFYTSVNRESEIQRTVALGNGFRLPGLQKFLQQNLGMPVKKLDTFKNLQLADNINAPNFSEHVLTMGVCYGLAVQALGLATVNSTLLPPEIVRQGMWARKQPWFIGAAACLVAAAGVTWMRYMWDISAARIGLQQAGQMASQTIEKYDQYSKQYRKLDSASGLATDRIKQIREIETDRIAPKLLELIASCIPQGQEQLVQARDPEQYKQVAKQIPRQERQQVFITRISQRYVSEITPELLKELEGPAMTVRKTAGPAAMPPGMYGAPGMYGPGMYGPGMGGAGMDMGAGGDMMMMDMGAGGDMYQQPGMGGAGRAPRGRTRAASGRRGGRSEKQTVQAKGANSGFKVVIEGTTPHENAPAFLTETLLKKLQGYTEQHAKENKLSFWVEKVYLNNCRKIGPSQDKRRFRSQTAARTDRSRRRQKPDTKKSEPTGAVDPLLTDELIENDSVFTVSCIVRLIGPETNKPEQEPEAQPRRRTGGRRARTNRTGA